MRHLVLISILLLASTVKGQYVQGQDKVYHAIGGAAISAGTYLGAYAYLKDLPQKERKSKSLLLSIGTTLCAAVGKEVFDTIRYKRAGTYTPEVASDSVADLATTFLAGATVTIIFSF
jgi:hypothetical protein